MSVSAADMTDVAVALMDKGDHLITASPTVKEAEVAKDNFASSVTVRVKNYLVVPLVAVRANPRAGEVSNTFIYHEFNFNSGKKGMVLADKT